MMPEYIQSQRRLMPTDVWTYVGFISAVVGLLCYALSSSFNHLFGNWNFLKFFLYSIFSFFIVFLTFFAKVLRFSTSTLLKTHMAVLVLIATTAYSYFYDKAVNIKPDAYILVSCVAFAVMSLSLSKQTRCGCEADLVNYFLGCLMILLIKLSLWLFFVGAGFSYSLIIFRSSLDAIPQSDFSENFVVIQVDSQHGNSDSVIPVDSQSVSIDSAAVQVSQHVNTDGATEIDSLKVNDARPFKKEEIDARKMKQDISNIGKLHFKKVVLKVDIHDDNIKKKALKAASRLSGVESISVDMTDKKLTLTGDVDPIYIVRKLRKLCRTEIVSVEAAKEEKKDDSPTRSMDEDPIGCVIM